MSKALSPFLFDSRSMDDAAYHILQLTKQYIGINTLFIAWNDRRTNRIMKAYNREDILAEAGDLLPFELSYCHLVVENGNRPLYIADTTAAPETAALEVTRRLGRCTFVGVPIRMEEFGACATICGLDKKPYALSERETDFLMTMAQLFGRMLELEYSVFHDPLTQFCNRKYLQELFEKEISRTDQPALLFFLDLDGFKCVNDRYGHDVGDLLLSTVARRLEDELREGDAGIRLGGDEFVLVLRATDSVKEPETMARRVLDSILAITDVDGQPVGMSASIGISAYPANGTHWQDLLQRADEAMYAAKADGRNRYRFFKED